MDWSGFSSSCEDHETITIPETVVPLSAESYQELIATVDPCAHSEFQGVDIYIQTLAFIERALVAYCSL